MAARPPDTPAWPGLRRRTSSRRTWHVVRLLVLLAAIAIGLALHLTHRDIGWITGPSSSSQATAQ
jgi:hypothetical protein